MTLRERTRQAVREDITRVAVGLFLERGYEATSIDEIARAVGMSQRSVFRYFATKEDIVVGKFNSGAERMLAQLRARPQGEPVWTSLRHMFHELDDIGDVEARRIQRMVFQTPALLSVYLRSLYTIQNAAVAILNERAAAAGHPPSSGDLSLRTLVGAAFACLVAAQEASLAAEDDTPLTTQIDRAMDTLVPRDQDWR